MGRTVPEGHLTMSGGSPPELRHTGAPSPCRVGALLATATIFKVTGHGPHQRRVLPPAILAADMRSDPDLRCPVPATHAAGSILCDSLRGDYAHLCGRDAPPCGSCRALFSSGTVGAVASHHIMTANQQCKSLQYSATNTDSMFTPKPRAGDLVYVVCRCRQPRHVQTSGASTSAPVG